MSTSGVVEVEPAVEAEALQTNLLTAQDRCDTCGSQAFYQVTFHFAKDNPLLFCNHHYQKADLAGKIDHEQDHVLDEFWKLNVKPSASSPD